MTQSFSDCLKRLEEILLLLLLLLYGNDGWLDGHGKAVKKEAVHLANTVIYQCGILPFIYPTENGGINLEWDDLISRDDPSMYRVHVCEIFGIEKPDDKKIHYFSFLASPSVDPVDFNIVMEDAYPSLVACIINSCLEHFNANDQA